MFEIIEAIIGLTLIYVALRYPPLIACIFLMFSMSQTFGMGAIFPGAISFIFSLMALMGTCVSFSKLWRCRKRNKITRRIFFIAVVAAISTLWTGLASFAGGGGGIIPIINSMTNNGIFIIIIVLAYWNSSWARKLIVLTIIIQLIISVAIIQLPDSPISIIKASMYNDVYSVDYDILKLEKPEYIRESGQFLNSLQLSFYSTAGIIIGLYILLISLNFYQRAIGLVLSLFALQAFYLSFSRGGGLILFIGAILYAIWQPAKYRLVTSIFIFFITALALLMQSDISTFISDDPFLNYVIDKTSKTGSDELDRYRYQAIIDSLDLIISNPLFGTGGNNEIFAQGKFNLPHQAPLNSAVINGLPDGICVTILYWLILAGFLIQIRQIVATKQSQHFINYQLIDRNEVRLATIIGLLVLIFGMTNQHAGKAFQYVCLGYACLPWIYTRAKNHITRNATLIMIT